MRCTLKDITSIERILKHPGVSGTISDDTEFDPLDVTIRLLKDPEVYVLKPYEGILIIFKKINRITYEAHVAIIESKRSLGTRASLEATGWLFKNTEARKIVAYVPGCNRLLEVFVRRALRMKQEGTLKGAFMKSNKIYDLLVFGATKDDYLKRLKQKGGRRECHQY
jgi:hypothetical protein